MNGDNINDVFVDESKRIWLANYPTGITVIDYRYENYHWMKHSMGNKQSIVNDQVHAVIEDSDGDLWFGTSNGMSLLSYHGYIYPGAYLCVKVNKERNIPRINLLYLSCIYRKYSLLPR